MVVHRTEKRKGREEYSQRFHCYSNFFPGITGVLAVLVLHTTYYDSFSKVGVAS